MKYFIYLLRYIYISFIQKYSLQIKTILFYKTLIENFFMTKKSGLFEVEVDFNFFKFENEVIVKYA